MYSRELTYTDLVTGEERKQTFYFNLTEFETTEWALMDDLEELVATRDRTRILRALRRLVRHSVCQRFGDEIGKPEYYGDIFIASNAHSVLMMDLLGANNEKVASTMSGFGAAMLVEIVSANLTAGYHPAIKVLGWFGSVGLGVKASEAAEEGMRSFLDTLF